MKGRYLTVVLTLVVAVALLPGALAGQSSNDWTPPQTPWGDPDLQGVWNNTVSTPLERPSRVWRQAVFIRRRAGGLCGGTAREA